MTRAHRRSALGRKEVLNRLGFGFCQPPEVRSGHQPSGQTIRNWVAEVDRSEGRREEKRPGADPGLTTAERDELIRLRRENRQLKLERDILSRARQPGLRGRLEFCRRGLPVHERRPGRLPDHGAGAHPRREGRVRCLGRPVALGATRGGRCPAEADPRRPYRLARDLWRAPRPCRPARAQGERHSCKRSARLRREAGPGRGQPSARWAPHDAAGPGGASGSRSRRPQPRCRGPEAPGGGTEGPRSYITDVPTPAGFLDLAVVLVLRQAQDEGLQPPDRRLGDGQPPPVGARPGRPGDGRHPAQAPRRDPLFGPGITIHVAGAQ
ncbi:hypothetical protein MPOCJGCO_2057 [Methylobacterium trifolii]|uniref:Transposase n=1 Tax=Methylobacterium trifolii TaxID=1003092 RepID=A0ABQ4TYG2_9HYPH|nr:hypothetical protein MPOCJGCO_2057 [Methylobacterium trifolii]